MCFLNVQLPEASSLQRTDQVCREIEAILKETPGIRYATSVVGFSLLSIVSTTYNAFFFVTLEPWHERKKPEEQLLPIFKNVNARLAALPEAQAFLFPPPAIPGVGASGGVSMVLEDRSGKDIAFLADNTQKFMEAAQKRPEIGRIDTTFIPDVPQVFARVDRDKVLKQGVSLSDVVPDATGLHGRGDGELTSTDSGVSGRSMCSLRESFAPKQRMSDNSMCATPTAIWSRCPRW